MGQLDDVDLTKRLSRKQEKERLDAAWTRLQVLRLTLGGQIGGQLGPGLCVVFEGWDAAGKGGCIKRLVNPLDPRHYSVYQFGAPSSREKRHHFLWRFWPKLPGWGGMVVFDRSWYGRVLVERVEELASEDQWRRSFREIAEFEHGLVEEGLILVKFWLHLSADEQLARFEKRSRDPLKAWKLTEEDWRNREKRAEYAAAVEDMFALTDTAAARWHVVPSESKRWARVEVLETVNREIEQGMRRWGMTVPLAYSELKAELRDNGTLLDDPPGAPVADM